MQEQDSKLICLAHPNVSKLVQQNPGHRLRQSQTKTQTTPASALYPGEGETQTMVHASRHGQLRRFPSLRRIKPENSKSTQLCASFLETCICMDKWLSKLSESSVVKSYWSTEAIEASSPHWVIQDSCGQTDHQFCKSCP